MNIADLTGERSGLALELEGNDQFRRRKLVGAVDIGLPTDLRQNFEVRQNRVGLGQGWGFGGGEG